MTMGENEDEDEDERERDGTPHYLPFLLTIDGRDFVHARHISLMFLFCSHDQEDTPFGAFCSSSSSSSIISRSRST